MQDKRHHHNGDYNAAMDILLAKKVEIGEMLQNYMDEYAGKLMDEG